MAAATDPQSKAAVMAALLTGQSISSVAREYKISKSTASLWKREAFERSVGSAPKKGGETEDLLFEYLNANLKSLCLQVEHFGDKAWLQTQDAAGLAVLHGVQTDKAIRLLEALNAGGQAEPESG